jgi:hypothetical protein
MVSLLEQLFLLVPSGSFNRIRSLTYTVDPDVEFLIFLAACVLAILLLSPRSSPLERIDDLESTPVSDCFDVLERVMADLDQMEK